MNHPWRLLPYGPADVLVETQQAHDVAHAAAALAEGPWEIVPAERTLLVRGDGRGLDPETVAEVLSRRWDAVSGYATPAGVVVEVPVTYDGEDLPEVARLAGLSVDEVIRRHVGGEYQAAFCGFAPGFAYLTGLDPTLHLDRRASPRARVPSGAVAIASRYTTVYPRAGPGGWHLIGRTDLTMWDLDRLPPAVLAPGTRVRFVPENRA